MAQQKIENPEELLHYQIRSVLTMEHHSLEALEELELAARDSKIKKLFSHHSDETREQIANLEKVFALLEYEQTTAPSPVTTGLSTAEASSRSAMVRACATVSRAAPCTCGEQRSEYASCTRVQTAGSR